MPLPDSEKLPASLVTVALTTNPQFPRPLLIRASRVAVMTAPS